MEFDDIFQNDWNILMGGARAWLEGLSPYGTAATNYDGGAFAYPPTALPGFALFALLGFLGFYVWTALILGLWWRLARDGQPHQLILALWGPIALHLIEGQSTLAATLIVWAAFKARARGWGWGFAIALALTKFQAILIPLLWLLWQDRRSPTRWRLWGGIAAGTLLLALPATVMNPLIWRDWLGSVRSYQGSQLFLAPWQGPGVVLLALAAYLWHRSGRGEWHWWLTGALWPQTSVYSLAAVLPAIAPPARSYRTLAGLGLGAALVAPVNAATLTWLLAGQMVVVWLLAGGRWRAEPPPDPPPADRPAE